MRVQRLKIYGERNSGTRLLARLIEQNIGFVLCPSDGRQFGAAMTAVDEESRRLAAPYAEFLRDALIDDLFLTVDAECQHKHTAPVYSGRFRQEAIGIICIVKNPYSWLASLYRRPYHLLLPKPATFGEFIRSPWPTIRRENLPAVLASPIELWNRKCAAYFHLIECAVADALPCLFIKFEDLVFDQISTLRCIRDVFDFPGDKEVPIIAAIKAIDAHLDTYYYQDYYRCEVWRTVFTREDFEYCNTIIDWEIAERFGYRRVDE